MAVIKHEMLTYNAAKKKGIEANFITSVVAKVGEKIVYEMSSSQFLSKNPILKFYVHANKGEMLSVAWTDKSGHSIIAS